MKSFVFELAQTDPVEVFDSLHDRPYALFLDSADRDHPHAKKSFIFVDPLQKIETGFQDLETIQDGIIAGYFGYDLARELEELPGQTKKSTTSPIAIGIYDAVLIFNHKTAAAEIKIYATDESTAKTKRDEILKLIKRKNKNHRPNAVLDWHPLKTVQDYQNDIQTIINQIHEGEVFQVNLSQRMEAELPENFKAWEHYKQLRDHNPAPFSAYFNTGKIQIASCSPERFLTLENGMIETRPIKGTLPAHKDANELLSSQKDRAENIMIVDLLRNDLSKVCEPHSIEVTGLCEIETFKGLHHLVSTICGKLKKDKTPLDALKACFPGGSITGAPKIRAMEIIDEIETHARGPYCGSIGYITPNGHMDTNILIRTLVFERDKVSLNVGGGITASSNPEAEYQETLDKAEKILESFAA